MILISLLLPLLAAGILPCLCQLRLGNAVRYVRPISFLFLQSAVSIFLFLVVFTEADAITLCSFGEHFAIAFRADPAADLLLLPIAVLFLAIAVAAAFRSERETSPCRLHAFTFLTETFLIASILSANLITLFTFTLLTSVAGFPLVLHNGTKEATRAAKRYLLSVSIGAAAVLYAILVLSRDAESLTFTARGVEIVISALTPSAILLLLLGFGAMTGIYPLQSGLVSAFTFAPAPEAALLSSTVPLAGVTALLRSVYFIIGPSLLLGTRVQTILLILSLLSMLITATLALSEKSLRRIFALTAVSGLSHLTTGILLCTLDGFASALFRIPFYTLTATICLLFADTVLRTTGKTKTEELFGIGRRLPLSSVLFTLAAFVLIGIPPSGGFFASWTLMSAALGTAASPLRYVIPAIILVSSLLTAASLLRIPIRAFYPGTERLPEFVAPESKREPLSNLLPLLFFSALLFLLGCFAGDLLAEMILRTASLLFR